MLVVRNIMETDIMNFWENAEKTGIIPVVVIDNAADAVPAANALLEGGIDFMEITMRTECALEAISLVKANVPQMKVGAGTVLNADAACLAIEAGASFIVSPGFDAGVVDLCLERDIPVVPGCVTPTEMTAAVNKGLKVVKFFPAETYGGIKTIKELSGVFRSLKFLPTGGINAGNMESYLAEPFIAAIGGSWVCSGKMIREGDFEGITEKCREAVANIARIRRGE